MWTVVGGDGRNTIARLCQDRTEAEQWAQQLAAAEISPISIGRTPSWREPSAVPDCGPGAASAPETAPTDLQPSYRSRVNDA